jgi:hypothetical protein
MIAKKFKWLTVGFLLVIAAIWAMGQYDYARLVAGKHPVFAPLELHLSDGGSIQYWGLGYSVTDEHEMRWGIEMQPEERLLTTNRIAPFRIGQTLDYWTPFVSRENTRFIIETNK